MAWLFGRRSPSEVSLVVVVEAEGLDESEQQRLNDMWCRLLFASGDRVMAVERIGRSRRERQAILANAAFTLHQWYKGYRDIVSERYGPQPLITKFEVWICRGNVVTAPEGEADVIAILDLRHGAVL